MTAVAVRGVGVGEAADAFGAERFGAGHFAATIAGLDHAVDQLVAIPADAVGAPGRAVRDVDRMIRRLQAYQLALVAAADRANVAASSGAASTGSWLAWQTRAGGGEAAAQVSLAVALTELPATSEALAAGSLSTKHAQVIAGATGQLPEGVPESARAKVEADLLRDARVLDPAKLRKAARRAIAEAAAAAAAAGGDAGSDADADAVEGELLRGEEERALRRTTLTMHDNGDGTTSGRFVVPTLAASILRKIVQQMTAPRRQGGRSSSGALTRPSTGGATGSTTAPPTPPPAIGSPRRGLDQPPAPGSAGSGDAAGSARADGAVGAPGAAGSARAEGAVGAPGAAGSAWADRSAATPGAPGGPVLDWAHERGLAFVDLLQRLPTDHLHGKVAATILVTMRLDALKQAIGVAGSDTGVDLSAATVRRLACEAGFVPLVLGGRSLPLDLGRSERFFNEPQRVALGGRYTECAAEGCDRPYAWCELHHEDPWARGGRTDLDKAVPLCGHHHRRVHDPRYRHVITCDPSGTKAIRFALRT